MAKAKLKVYPAEQDRAGDPLPHVKLSEQTPEEIQDWLRRARKKINQHKAHVQKLKQAIAIVRGFRQSASPKEIEWVERRLQESNLPPGTPRDIGGLERLVPDDDEIERLEKALN